jgi:predicted nucleic acid-binding protein
MNIVDANVLLYVINSAAQHHTPSRRWLDGPRWAPPDSLLT